MKQSDDDEFKHLILSLPGFALPDYKRMTDAEFAAWQAQGCPLVHVENKRARRQVREAFFIARQVLIKSATRCHACQSVITLTKPPKPPADCWSCDWVWHFLRAFAQKRGEEEKQRLRQG